MTVLISIDPSFGNCVGLYKTLSLNDDVVAVFRQRDPKGFSDKIPCVYGFDNIPNADRYYIVSSDAFTSTNTPKKKTTVILTDSYYLQYHKKINQILDGYRVFCMPDLSKYCTVEHKLYYPSFEYGGKIEKNDSLTLAHSPYSREKCGQKGTQKIEDAIEGLDIKLDVITGMSWEKAIDRKSHAHMFVDQIADRLFNYSGGLGKSGVEAMALKCLTFTSGGPIDGDIPAPPVEWIDKNTIAKRIKYYIDNDSRMIDKTQDQFDWYKEYLNYKFQASYLC